MKDALMNLCNTLNQIEVKGKNNLAYLLGCIGELERLLKELDSEEKQGDGP